MADRIKLKIFVDFNNADTQGRVRLNCAGTLEDLAQQRIELREGLNLTLYSEDANNQGKMDELLVEGVVTYSQEEQGWVAAIDWRGIRYASDLEKNGVASRPVVK